MGVCVDWNQQRAGRCWPLARVSVAHVCDPRAVKSADRSPETGVSPQDRRSTATNRQQDNRRRPIGITATFSGRMLGGIRHHHAPQGIKVLRSGQSTPLPGTHVWSSNSLCQMFEAAIGGGIGGGMPSKPPS